MCFAAAKHEHFGRAAKECRVCQPSLSTQIKKIEGYLGVILFERNSRRMTTTQTGKKLAKQAVVILDEARKIPDTLDQPSTSQLVSLKLGVILVMGRVFMDPLECPFSCGKKEIKAGS